MSQLIRRKSNALSAAHCKQATYGKDEIIASSAYLTALKRHPEAFHFTGIFGSLMSGICGGVGSIAAFADSGPQLGIALAAATVVSTGALVRTGSIAGAFHFRYIGTPIGDTFVRRVVSKRSRKLDRKLGWRPRQGLPHPRRRTDTYDRFIIETTVNAQEDYVLQLQRWEYTGKHWRQACLVEKQHTADNETDMMEIYGDLSEKALAFNQESQQQWETKHIDGESTKSLIAAQLNANQPGL